VKGEGWLTLQRGKEGGSKGVSRMRIPKNLLFDGKKLLMRSKKVMGRFLFDGGIRVLVGLPTGRTGKGLRALLSHEGGSLLGNR